jgi:1,4-dihydroxy-2-naphthoyl-CoA hydrolase
MSENTNTPKSIWFREHKAEDAAYAFKDTMMEAIGIEIIEITPNSLKGRMPVDNRTVQPMRILHGGASVALAETLGSMASGFVIDLSQYLCVGLEINANHLRPVNSGYVYGEAKPIHLGRKTHVWSIEIKNEEGKMVCISRITMSIIDMKSKE